MALQPTANLDDVLSRSGNRGWDANLAFNQPDSIQTETSGGGSITFGAYGASLNPGSTDGDYARIKGLTGKYFEGGGYKRTVLMWNADFSNPPTSGTWYLGDMDGGFDGTGTKEQGAYWDVVNGEFAVDESNDKTTKPAPTPGGADDGVLIIEQDNNVVSFELYGSVTASAEIEAGGGSVNTRGYKFEATSDGSTDPGEMDLGIIKEVILHEGV